MKSSPSVPLLLLAFLFVGLFLRVGAALRFPTVDSPDEIAVYTMHYNFCRIHKSLRVTPAMEAGITDHVWTIEEMLSKIGL